jgi:hypothetical protein
MVLAVEAILDLVHANYMNAKSILFIMPVPSTDFTKEAFLDCSGTSPIIRYEFSVGEVLCRSGIKFNQVSAFKHHGERCCRAWHIEGAYDTLVEIHNSSWVSELRNDVPEIYRADWNPHHYMIYLDSVGCFELLAQSWDTLPANESDHLDPNYHS